MVMFPSDDAECCQTTFEAMRSDESELVKMGVEFWTSLCEKEQMLQDAVCVRS
jgi:hypothetical protein